MNGHVHVAFGPILATVVAGCVPRGDSVSLDFDGTFEISESGSEMEGELEPEGGTPNQEVYRDVTVKLYSRDGELFLEERQGDLAADGELAVFLRADRAPHFVVFDSSDFWREPIEVEYYERVADRYGIREAEARDELPVSASA